MAVVTAATAVLLLPAGCDTEKEAEPQEAARDTADLQAWTEIARVL